MSVRDSNNWNSLAQKYKTGGYTEDVARFMISKTDVNDTSTVLDNGCGPGVVSGELLAICKPTVHAVDFSSGMIEQLRAKNLPVKSEVMDAQDLNFDDNTFTHQFTGFVLFAVPDAQQAANELYRTCKPGGTCVVSLHHHVGWTESVHRMQKSVHPELPLLKMPMSEDWLLRDKGKELLTNAGFACEVYEFHGRVKVDDIIGMHSHPLFNFCEGWAHDEKNEFERIYKSFLTPDELKNGIMMSAWITVAKKPN